MSYLIDGHNLIPKIPGLHLEDTDDEMRLVELLQVFCRHKQKKVEVYFDGSPAGFSGTRRFGQVTAHFVRKGVEADDAIIQRLTQLGRTARNWSVVTSDRRIQAQARSSYTQIIPSERFAADLMELVRNGTGTVEEQPFQTMSKEEMDEWLEIFSGNDHPLP